MKFSEILKYILISVVLYLFLFQPIISKYLYLGTELLLFCVYVFVRRKRLGEYIITFRKELKYALIIIIFSLFRDLISGEMVFSDRFLTSFFQCYFVSFILIDIFFNNPQGNDEKKLLDCLIVVLVIATSITCLAVLNPSFADFVFNYATEDAKEYIERTENIRYRSYGLSESLNFTYAYVLSVIGYYLLCERINIVTPLLIVMLIVTIMFNSRISFLPLLFYFIYLFFFKRKRTKSIFKTTTLIALIICVGFYILEQFPMLNNEWGLSFFLELADIFKGNTDDTTLGILTGRMFFLPDENILELIFGTGVSTFTSATHQSDVGYVQQVYYGGFILLLVIISYFSYISRRVIKYLSVHHWFTLIFIFSVFVLNFKGFYLSAIPGPRFLTLLYVFYIIKYVKLSKSYVEKSIDEV